MSNHITSINSLINQESNADEDRKFLRAAAEAIVATSMNKQIDPTILELLKRIQYASANETSNQQNSNDSNDLAFNNNSLHFLNNETIQPNRSHFPSFNLNYFDSLNGSTPSSTNSTANSAGNSAGNSTSNWNTFHSPSILNSNSPINHNSSNSITTPLSINSTTPPSTNQQQLTPGSAVSRDRHDSISSLNNPEKPFICNDCSLSFRRSSDLRRHQRAHLPILPHICQLCGKGFARKDALKRHSDTLTCKRNREKLLSSGGDLDSILTQAKK